MSETPPPIVVSRPIPIVLSIVAGYVDGCTYPRPVRCFRCAADRKSGADRSGVREERVGRPRQTPRHSLFLSRRRRHNGARPLPERTAARGVGLEPGGRMHLADRAVGVVPRRHAVSRSGRAGRDRHAAFRDGRHGGTKRARASVDARRCVDQCDDDEHDDTRHQRVRIFARLVRSIGDFAERARAPRACRGITALGWASSWGRLSARSPTSRWDCPASCWPFCRLAVWCCGTRGLTEHRRARRTGR